ncbi:hypothetical protein BBJ28_00020046 [Nothophytophthora sp. Chile5]|nr:hypothetical protein BBJ28_00020046 [Nothophytophthora sp. Chile5]
MLRLLGRGRRRVGGSASGVLRCAGVALAADPHVKRLDDCIGLAALAKRPFGSTPPLSSSNSPLSSSSSLHWKETVSPAFRAFLKSHMHLMIPIRFVVPKDDELWPRATWGYPLGKHAAWLRKQRREGGVIPSFVIADLEEMAFAWENNQYRWDHFIFPALRRFFELHGHTDVPAAFHVLKGDVDWPERLWGRRLGQTVSDMRKRHDYEKQVRSNLEELAAMGFCYDSTIADRDWREKVLPALKTFHQVYGHCRVWNSFVVPDEPRWPVAARGKKLGYTVSNMRRKGYFADQVARDELELKELGFAWGHSDWEWKEWLLPTLETFRAVFGHCRVPASFVVPSDAPWPKQAYGRQLGVVASQIRYKANYFDQVVRSTDRLASLGFEWRIPPSKWEQRIKPLLVTFEQLHGSRDVPLDYIVPSEAPWEENGWGIPLGKLLLKKPT